MQLKSICLFIVGSDLAAIYRSRCYNRVLRYKRALDRVGENEIKPDFTNDDTFRVKRLAKESGQKPEAKKSFKFGDVNVNNNPSRRITSGPRAGIAAFLFATTLPPVFTFGAVSPVTPVATLPTRGFLATNGLLQDAFQSNNTRFHWPIVGLDVSSTPSPGQTFTKTSLFDSKTNLDAY